VLADTLADVAVLEMPLAWIQRIRVGTRSDSVIYLAVGQQVVEMERVGAGEVALELEVRQCMRTVYECIVSTVYSEYSV
jgi:hypothetical protein